MIEFIQGETKKIMYKCCESQSKKHQVEIEKIQLILGLDEEGNTYTICKEYTPVEQLDFLGVLGVKIDFLGYSRIAPPFIVKSLVRFSETHGLELGSTKVMCVPTKNEKGKGDMFLFLYDGGRYVETITFADLFDERDVELPQQQ